MINRTRKPVSRHTRRFESRDIRRRFNESEESNIIYTANRASFYSEEDSYEEGIIDSGVSWDENLNIKAKSLDELFRKVKQELGMSQNNNDYFWEVESSDMNNRSCFLVNYMADEENYLASKSQIENWKKGKQRLWLVSGSIRIMKTVNPSNVPDDELEVFARENNLDIV